MAETLNQLADIISNSVSALVNICAADGAAFPSLDDNFSPEFEGFRKNPLAAEAANLIATAVCSLHNYPFFMQFPGLPYRISTHFMLLQHFESAALRVCLESNVIEVLREAGPSVDIDAMKLGRLLRYLATHHIFREVSPEVFANNRVSSILDSGKSLEALQASPTSKHEGTIGLAALAGHLLDESHKSSAYAFENLTHPDTKFSGEPFHAPPSIINGVLNFLPGFDWKSLADDATVVDVGGGVGSSSLLLAKQFLPLHIVVQDRPAVVEEGVKVWNDIFPGSLESGRIQLQAHDFFTPQTVRDASVFLLKQILHDWSDIYASRILVQLRQAATPHTKILLFETILPYACRTYLDDTDEIPGGVPEAPPPLIANYGATNVMGYNGDMGHMAMLLHHNSQERTLRQMDRLLSACGWKIV
ncbi:S-adenosyl-L-methionine-dependent methyltransferase [Mycena maculata]|uniref:S-adenosyl-L-methionine-dependent methyltransferase n=1 Tax=Mycena maculata TaxID=230809 RepID=A0AAD7I4D1_9AGAR|nr:S-adenosyl-L-methionine-dependent methyltransferase [Mycena maculata]